MRKRGEGEVDGGGGGEGGDCVLTAGEYGAGKGREVR